MTEIKVLVEGGKASAGAPLGPALGPLGVNIGDIVAKINEKTNSYAGMKVPVIVDVDVGTKTFEIFVGSPPTSALIKKEIGIDKGSSNPKAEIKGNVSMEQIKNVIEMKIEKLASYKMKSAAKEIIGVCNSMGLTIEEKPAREVIKEINEGKFDELLKD